jgi:hypothetical protein
MDEMYRQSWDPGLERHRSPYVFRGRCDARADLSTGLMRLAGDYADISRLESHLLRNFRKYAHSDADAAVGASVWNWLALAQHHGLNTRLLDWTYSPLVAAHFATDNVATYDLDGVVWAVDHRKTLEWLPKPLRAHAEEEGANVFTAEMLDRSANTLEAFDGLAPEPFAVFLEPPSLDQRIVNQFALFSLVSNPRMSLDEWLAGHPGVARKIIIPAGIKWEIRDKLDQAGITERMLLPGLDGLSRWLARYYTPKNRITSRSPEPPCSTGEGGGK